MKNKHYSLNNILKTDALYYLLYGERANGKSYAVKLRCLEKAYENPKTEKFVYLRRWLEDVSKNRAEGYWDDMEYDDEGNRRIEEITHGEYTCISVYRNEIYFANRDEKEKKVRGVMIGRVAVLTGDTHEKSRSFVGYSRIIFEEMITESGYLGNEVSTFMSMVSTILRKRVGEVFLIGNTLTRACPYFREWELINVPKQKQGTIDIYNYKLEDKDENGNELYVKIACEYCENVQGRTRMIFGNKMITRGEWQTEEKEHLPDLYGEYERHLSILLDDELEHFVIDVLSHENIPLLYIREVDRRWINRNKYDIIITDRFSYEQKYMKDLSAIPKLRKFIKWLFDSGKVCYQDNLVGTTFLTLLNNRKIW